MRKSEFLSRLKFIASYLLLTFIFAVQMFNENLSVAQSASSWFDILLLGGKRIYESNLIVSTNFAFPSQLKCYLIFVSAQFILETMQQRCTSLHRRILQARDDRSVYSSRHARPSRERRVFARDFQSFAFLQLVEPVSLSPSRLTRILDFQPAQFCQNTFRE